jgi:hypothetical protein
MERATNLHMRKWESSGWYTGLLFFGHRAPQGWDLVTLLAELPDRAESPSKFLGLLRFRTSTHTQHQLINQKKTIMHPCHAIFCNVPLYLGFNNASSRIWNQRYLANQILRTPSCSTFQQTTHIFAAFLDLRNLPRSAYLHVSQRC